MTPNGIGFSFLFLSQLNSITKVFMHVQLKVVRLFVGSFFTSLDMQGASISLLPVDADRLARLDAPTQVGFC